MPKDCDLYTSTIFNLRGRFSIAQRRANCKPFAKFYRGLEVGSGAHDCPLFFFMHGFCTIFM